MHAEASTYQESVERVEQSLRGNLTSALQRLRTGWPVYWRLVDVSLRYYRMRAFHFANVAAAEVAELNHELRSSNPGSRMRYTIPRKPRWSPKKARPAPNAITPDQIERFLVACVQLADAVHACADAIEGDCYPHMPESMQSVLTEMGLDPHSHFSPGRLVARYLRGY